MKTYTPEQLELMVSKAANQTVDTETAERVLRQAAAQARVIAGMEAWLRAHHDDLSLSELERLLADNNIWFDRWLNYEYKRLAAETTPKDQP